MNFELVGVDIASTLQSSGFKPLFLNGIKEPIRRSIAVENIPANWLLRNSGLNPLDCNVLAMSTPTSSKFINLRSSAFSTECMSQVNVQLIHKNTATKTTICVSAGDME